MGRGAPGAAAGGITCPCANPAAATAAARAISAASQTAQLTGGQTAAPAHSAEDGGPDAKGRPHHHHAAHAEHAANCLSCAVHCRMAAWTWEQVEAKIADPALKFTKVQQGMLQARLRPLQPVDWAFYLGGDDNGIITGRLRIIEPTLGGCMSST